MSSERPNIILITTDQQRNDTWGPFAPSFMRTPHLNVLANEGITFRRAYADCPICVPSRLTIMNGQYAHTHGMRGNGSSSETLDDTCTLPTLMRQAGYQTAAIGKMHFTPERARHGFEEMLLPADYYRQMNRSGNPLQPMHHGLGQNELHPGMATVPEAMTLTSWIAEQSVEYLKERRDPTKPFFLWTSFSKPHPPLDPPEPYYSMYRNCDIPKPVYGDWASDENCPWPVKAFRKRWSLDQLPPDLIHEARAAYLGLITQIDYNMGRIFAALQDQDMLRDTLILFTSDHGEFLGDHHTGCKIFFHEASAHIPMILRLPKSWQDRCHGMQSDALVTLADVLPTLVNAAGGQAPDGVDGRDLLAVTRGQAEARQYLIGTAHGEPPENLAITDGDWKYIFYPLGGAQQLFNLREDPQELHDLSEDAEALPQLERLRELMINDFTQRELPWVKEGILISYPEPVISDEDLRNEPWPGFHTELYGVDVRH